MKIEITRIERFLDHFQRKFECIRSLDLEEGNEGIRLTLYSSMIDALSKTVSNPEDSNRERFVSIIANFGNWPEGEKVSATHLAALLEKMNSPEFSDLKALVHAKIDKWYGNALIYIQDDFDETELKKLWPKNVRKVYDDLSIEHIKHKSLFYRYRNALVHEFRKPGHGMSFEGETSPYYHTITEIGTNRKSLALVYPTSFHEAVLSSILSNLKSYYIKDRIDPYKCFTFGKYWIESLNR